MNTQFKRTLVNVAIMAATAATTSGCSRGGGGRDDNSPPPENKADLALAMSATYFSSCKFSCDPSYGPSPA
jgi:hypothetical protein